MFTIEDIMGQLQSLFAGGNYQGNGATTFAAPTTAAPQVNGNNAAFVSPANVGTVNPAAGGFGMNMGTVGLGLQGLSSLSNLIQGNKALDLSKDQFKFQKAFANTNLNNSIKSYNTALEDRYNSRAVAEGRTSESAAEQIERNRLTR